MGFGNNLKKLRGKKTRIEIANKIGVSLASYSAYEREERIPRDSVKKRISEIYGETVQNIFFSQWRYKKQQKQIKDTKTIRDKQEVRSIYEKKHNNIFSSNSYLCSTLLCWKREILD